MSDEEIILDEEPVNPDVSDEPSSDNTTSTTSIRYCTVEDITNLFGDNVTDTIETNLIETAIDNATGWIHGRLRARSVPLPDPTNFSSSIKTVAMYYAASDCYGALFNGDEYHVNFDMWYIKAKELLDDYIDAYWNSCAEEQEQLAHNCVRHNKVLSYNQRRNRRRVF